LLSNIMIQKIKTLPCILSIKEVAMFFDINYLTVYRLVYKKEIKAYQDDEKNWCINRWDLATFVSKSCNL